MYYAINTSYISNTNNRSLRTRTETRHLVVHSTDDPGATARNLLGYWNSTNADANTHGAIDPTEVLVMLPFNEVSWSVGKPANEFTENYELCMPRTHDPAYFAQLWSIATDWFAKRCMDYNKDATFIKSHDEIRALYGGTDHTDPVAYFQEYGKTVDDFRADVQKIINAAKAPKQAATPAPVAPVAPPEPTALTPEQVAAEEVLAAVGKQWGIASEAHQPILHFAADAIRNQYKVN